MRSYIHYIVPPCLVSNYRACALILIEVQIWLKRIWTSGEKVKSPRWIEHSGSLKILHWIKFCLAVFYSVEKYKINKYKVFLEFVYGYANSYWYIYDIFKINIDYIWKLDFKVVWRLGIKLRYRICHFCDILPMEMPNIKDFRI